MKKKFGILAALLLCFSLVLSACGSGEGQVKDAADGFLGSLEKGDFKEATKYSSQGLLDSGYLKDVATLENLNGEFAAALGIKEKDLTDEAKKSIEDFTAAVMDSLVESYEIEDVKAQDESGTVTAKVTFGFNLNKAGSIELDSEMNKLAEKYIEDNIIELTESSINDKDGAFEKKMMNELIPKVLELYKKKLMKTGKTEQELTLILEKEDGNFVVTRVES